ncbi:MAG: 2-C-methyl-D-erythritol 2,4-cyclodiphosphate synthase [candidate division WOR-3 bacterium]|nr:2-C-methyl-D-erythritol 2,4-cyclodiphosphate synthase [candidate division WOR-3 bacterium]
MKTNLRIGIGFDAHNLVKNRKLILGGIEIKYSKGLLGHSDADVICHAIADALLGAAGLNDIGYYFPDTDEKLKNISSLKILSRVLLMIAKQDYKIINIDTVIICQAPKLNPYFPKMKAKLASVLKIDRSQIGLKAKTTEGINLLKANQSIGCIAVAMLAKKN